MPSKKIIFTITLPSRKFSNILSILVLLSLNGYAQSQTLDSSIKKFLEITPSLSISETWTDSIRTGVMQSDSITEISPGISLISKTGIFNGYLDYRANKIIYAINKSSNQIQNSLNTNVQFEAIENFLFIDARGQVSQQFISALGPSSPIDSLVNENRTEVSNYRISPSIKGHVLDLANYEVRISRSLTTSQSDLRPSIGQTDLSFNISGETPVQGLGWSVNSSRQTIGLGTERAVEADQFLVGIKYALTPQIDIKASGGFDKDNYLSLEKEKNSSSQFSIDWRQSDITTLSAAIDQRSFGRTHQLNLNHRTGRTAWNFSTVKNVTTSPNQETLGSLGSLYDILFNQFASLEPNLVLRAQLVNAYLQVNNLSPNLKVLIPFLTSAINITSRQELMFALLGIRSTMTFIVSQAKSQRLDSQSAAIDDLSSGNSIDQQGLSINFSHRLSPELTMSILNSRQKISSNNGLPGEAINLLSINLAKIISNNSTVSFGFRSISTSGLVEASRESAITINLNLSF